MINKEHTLSAVISPYSLTAQIWQNGFIATEVNDCLTSFLCPDIAHEKALADAQYFCDLHNATLTEEPPILNSCEWEVNDGIIYITDEGPMRPPMFNKTDLINMLKELK